MTPFEIDKCLDTFSILVDTREQPTDRFRRRCEDFGVPYERVALDYGDYAFQCTLPNGDPFHIIGDRIYPICAVERKMSLDELAMCFTHERKRFEAEYMRAKKNNARIYLLVENATMENLFNGKYRSQFNPGAYKASLFAFCARYNTIPIFCKAESTGKVIREILYRELKEALHRME